MITFQSDFGVAFFVPNFSERQKGYLWGDIAAEGEGAERGHFLLCSISQANKTGVSPDKIYASLSS